jgi:hypothetical protein
MRANLNLDHLYVYLYDYTSYGVRDRRLGNNFMFVLGV